jgi:hypothetical protein
MAAARAHPWLCHGRVDEQRDELAAFQGLMSPVLSTKRYHTSAGAADRLQCRISRRPDSCYGSSATERVEAAPRRLSAFARKRTSSRSSRYVRLVPLATERSAANSSPYSIIRSARASTVSGIVMPRAFVVRKLIDSFELRGLLDRQIGRLRPGQYLRHVTGSAMIHRSPWRPITHQGAGVGNSVFVDKRRRNVVLAKGVM